MKSINSCQHHHLKMHFVKYHFEKHLSKPKQIKTHSFLTKASLIHGDFSIIHIQQEIGFKCMFMIHPTCGYKFSKFIDINYFFFFFFFFFLFFFCWYGLEGSFIPVVKNLWFIRVVQLKLLLQQSTTRFKSSTFRPIHRQLACLTTHP
jgi:hypothetical protein